MKDKKKTSLFDDLHYFFHKKKLPEVNIEIIQVSRLNEYEFLAKLRIDDNKILAIVGYEHAQLVLLD